MVPRKCERKKIGRKNGRKEKIKERNINFFTCLIIYGKFREKEFIFFCLINHEKKFRKNRRKTKSIICFK